MPGYAHYEKMRRARTNTVQLGEVSGTWLDGGAVYPCTQPCQCRSGERCADGFCEPDVIPTRFVVLGADGGGTSAASPTGNLLSMDGGTVVVGLLAADTWDLGAATLLVPSNTHIAGGFTVCGLNRWVRDRSARTLLVSTGTAPAAGTGVIAGPGGLVTPTLRSTVSGITVRGTGTARCGVGIAHFRYANELKVEDFDVDLQLGLCSGQPGLRTMGLLVEDSNNVTLRRVRLLANTGAGNTPSGFLSIARSNGLVEDVSTATGVSVSNEFHAVEVLAPSSGITSDALMTAWGAMARRPASCSPASARIIEA